MPTPDQVDNMSKAESGKQTEDNLWVIVEYQWRTNKDKYQESYHWLPCYIYAASETKETLKRIQLYGNLHHWNTKI